MSVDHESDEVRRILRVLYVSHDQRESARLRRELNKLLRMRDKKRLVNIVSDSGKVYRATAWGWKAYSLAIDALRYIWRRGGGGERAPATHA